MATITTEDFPVYEGNTYSERWTLKEDGTAVDISGDIIEFVFHPDVRDATSTTYSTATSGVAKVGGGTGGQVDITYDVASDFADTDEYRYHLDRLVGGSASQRVTYAKGTITVLNL